MCSSLRVLLEYGSTASVPDGQAVGEASGKTIVFLELWRECVSYGLHGNSFGYSECHKGMQCKQQPPKQLIERVTMDTNPEDRSEGKAKSSSRHVEMKVSSET